MTYWLLTYMTFSCPGWILSGVIPDSVAPMVCENNLEAQLISSKREAYALAEKMELKEKHPTLYYCRGLKCWQKEISVKKTVEIK